MKLLILGILIGVLLTVVYNDVKERVSDVPEIYKQDLSNSTKVTSFCQKEDYDYGITNTTDPSTFTHYNTNLFTDEHIICVKTDFSRKTDEFTYKDYFKFRIGNW